MWNLPQKIPGQRPSNVHGPTSRQNQAADRSCSIKKIALINVGTPSASVLGVLSFGVPDDVMRRLTVTVSMPTDAQMICASLLCGIGSRLRYAFLFRTRIRAASVRRASSVSISPESILARPREPKSAAQVWSLAPASKVPHVMRPAYGTPHSAGDPY